MTRTGVGFESCGALRGVLVGMGSAGRSRREGKALPLKTERTEWTKIATFVCSDHE